MVLEKNNIFPFLRKISHGCHGMGHLKPGTFDGKKSQAAIYPMTSGVSMSASWRAQGSHGRSLGLDG